MVRERPSFPTNYSPDGPLLGAILDVLCDVRDLLAVRLPTGVVGEPALPVTAVAEPAPDSTPASAVAVREPAPPRRGRGSGADVWRVYADRHAVPTPAGASRDDIIAACVDAGVLDPDGSE